jgi:hypothetical protein
VSSMQTSSTNESELPPKLTYSQSFSDFPAVRLLKNDSSRVQAEASGLKQDIDDNYLSKVDPVDI